MRNLRKATLIWLGSLMFLGLVLATNAGAWQRLADDPAAAPATLVKDVAVIADTTATMQPELDALAAAFKGSSLTNTAVARTYHLLGYKDKANYLGNTEAPPTFYNWLNSLTATGGGDCPDAMLQALALLGRNVVDTPALVVSDAAPLGNRARLAFIINRLAEQGINVYPVITDWCGGTEFTQASMLTLSRLTGGIPYVVDESEVLTATAAAFEALSRVDTLLADNNEVDNNVKVYPLSIDNTVTTLGVEEEVCSPVWCLTCTRGIEDGVPTALLSPTVQLQVRAPDGNLVQPGDPGVKVFQTGSGTAYLIDVTQFTGPLTATWEIIVQGSGGYVLNAYADSSLHFHYLGRHALRSNKPVPIRVQLGSEPGAPPVQQVDFGLMRYDNSTIRDLDLFDDGQHGDGAAGDGVYGGMATPPQGIWYLVAEGKLADGSLFRRVDATPVRVKGFNMRGPADSSQLPGSSVVENFSVTNEGTEAQTYAVYVDSSQGWAVTGTVPATITVGAGETAVLPVSVLVPGDAAAGEMEETSLTIVEMDDLAASETVAVETTVVDTLTIYLPAIRRP